MGRANNKYKEKTVESTERSVVSDTYEDSSFVTISTDEKSDTDSDTARGEKFTRVLSKETVRKKLSELQQKSPAVALIAGPPSYFGESLWFLKGKKVVIGRGETANIQIDDPSISKEHGVFFMGEKINYVDLRSTNGTHINNILVPANKNISLKDNDVVQLGNVRVKFLEAGHMHQEMYKKLQTDSLTGIHNRGSLDTTANYMIRIAHSTKDKLGVILFDIDDFKVVNDTFGHRAGDLVLKKVVKISSMYLTSDDLFGRLGGDEFCIILSYTDKKDIYTIANCICRAIAKHNFFYKEKKVKVTCSFGVSFFKPGKDSWEILLDRADKAHYESKRNGKNMVS